MARDGEGMPARRAGVCRLPTVHRPEIWVPSPRTVTADLSMDHLAVDLAQLKTSSCGKSYILVVLDIFTRFAWLYRLPDKSGVTVVAALKSLFATFGKPLYILSDNGSDFRNL